MTRVINFFGGPDAGKSTNAAGLFYRLKKAGINCEYVPEFAKDKVWEGSLNVLKDQLYITAKQHNRLFRLNNKVELIITDSPLLLGLIYGDKESPLYKSLVIEKFNSFSNINIFLERTKPFEQAGRLQNELESRQIDTKILNMLRQNDIRYETIEENSDTVDIVFQLIIDSGINIAT